MEKELKITLDDKDSRLWGPNECALRLMMARHGFPYAKLPYVDENSTRAERDYICQQMMKQYRNIIEISKTHIVDEVEIQEQTALVVNFLLKTVVAAAFIAAFLILMFT